MKYIFLGLFFVAAFIHLYASYKCDIKLRAASKGFIIPALLGWYCFSVGHISLLVVGALVTSWLGDVLLILKGVKWFARGGVSFFVSHLLFVLVYLPNIQFNDLNISVVLIISLVYFTAIILEFRGLKPHLPQVLFIPMFIYLMVNGCMNVFAWFQMFSVCCTATVLTLSGAVLFFVSDSILFFVRFNRQSKWKSHFPVMVSYISGEFFIVLGIILLG